MNSEGVGLRTRSRTSEPGCLDRGYPPVPVNGAAYFGAAVLFFVFAQVSALPDPPLPFSGNLLQSTVRPGWEHGYILANVLWGLHFVRRFFEVLFVHEYHRTMPLLETAGAWIYYWVLAVWNGWAVNHHLGFHSPPVPMFAVGAGLFVVGELGNAAAHISLRNLRKRPSSPEQEIVTISGSRHVIPGGCLFSLVSCPHYLFEIITWLGFALLVFTLPSLLLFAATVVTLVIYSHKRHRAYNQEFDGMDGRPLYPQSRKALVPFIF